MNSSIQKDWIELEDNTENDRTDLWNEAEYACEWIVERGVDNTTTIWRVDDDYADETVEKICQVPDEFHI